MASLRQRPTAAIVTRQGDAGRTRLLSGDWVSKNCLRIEAVGTLDELVSALGVARSQAGPAIGRAILELQRRLFRAGSELVSPADRAASIPDRIGSGDVEWMDRACARLEREARPPQGFVVPGGSRLGAALDFARAVARRLERRVVGLFEGGELSNPTLLQWLNRLSDYLWLLARRAERRPDLLVSAQPPGRRKRRPA